MKHNYEILKQADSFAYDGDVLGMYQKLRELTLADYCMLHLSVPGVFESLEKLLPKQPSENIQKRWVGDSGQSLMVRSCSLVRLFDWISWRATGSGLSGKRILDYGCGYGRLLRLMNYFSDYENIVGWDAMSESLDICKSTGIHNQTLLVEARPHIPVPSMPKEFDFIYLFSIFSHTPYDVISIILNYIGNCTNNTSIVVCTIRTLEWLHVRKGVWSNELIAKMESEYKVSQYSFMPLNGDKDSLDKFDYGDTIMTPSYFSGIANQAGWSVIGMERDLSEPFQICISLKKSLE